MELSQGTIDIIKATAPVVEQHGLAITKRFYENLFENHPYVNNFFNKSHVFPENGEISPQVSFLRFSCLFFKYSWIKGFFFGPRKEHELDLSNEVLCALVG